MPQLSVVIITFNEERNIIRCLESVKPIADDIVVVDSLSTDRTHELCRDYKVDFVQRSWEGYSQAKNFGNARARHDIVLSMDADEALSPLLQRSVSEIKQPPDAEAYSFNRLTNYCGKWIRHGGWYPDVKVRLFNRTKARWEGAVHERLAGIDGRTIKLLRGDCYHYTYYSVSEHLRKADNLSDLSARELFERGKTASLLAPFLHPAVRFMRDYFLKSGILDGRNGLVIAAISAYANYLKYARLARLHRERRQRP